MTNERSSKIPKSSIYFVILLCFCISLVTGILEKPRIEQYKVFKIYTKADNKVYDSVDKGILKQLNIVNAEFEKQYNSDVKLKILPQEGVNSYYNMRFVDSKVISNEYMDEVYAKYIEFIKGKNISKIIHISPVEYQNVNYANVRVNNIIVKLIQALVFSIAFLLLYNIIKSKIDSQKLKIFSVLSILLFLVGVLVSGLVIIITVYFALAAIISVMDRNQENRKAIAWVCVIGLLMRVVVTMAMVAYNYYKFKTLYSYTQTDEIFYYSTGDYIYQYLVNFKIPNLKAITGIDQYGYNLFMGFVKFINNSDVFFSVKLINILVSVVFVGLFYEFVYKITNKKNVAIISAALMAIMPTFSVFSSFALRDIFISLSIFIILSEVINLMNSDKKLGSIIKILIFMVVLWYVRRYALLLTLAFSALYMIIKFCVDRKINILLIFIALALVLMGLIVTASKLYSFNIFNMIVNYVLGVGILKFISGLILSLVNLDFLINSGATLYTSTKSIILRSLYPETLFLIITFPIMCLGMIKAKAKNISLVITITLMFIGFISIYKIQYGGWFLRTQLQIFPYQYMFIAWGLSELMVNSRFKIFRADA